MQRERQQKHLGTGVDRRHAGGGRPRPRGQAAPDRMLPQASGPKGSRALGGAREEDGKGKCCQMRESAVLDLPPARRPRTPKGREGPKAQFGFPSTQAQPPTHHIPCTPPGKENCDRGRHAQKKVGVWPGYGPPGHPPPLLSSTLSFIYRAPNKCSRS